MKIKENRNLMEMKLGLFFFFFFKNKKHKSFYIYPYLILYAETKESHYAQLPTNRLKIRMTSFLLVVQ